LEVKTPPGRSEEKTGQYHFILNREGTKR